MRRLALFCGGFAAGIFLAQYLLPGGWLLSGGLVCLALGFGALLLPECWRKRAILCLVGAALALGWNWLYVRQVSEPMEALADTQQALTMTLTEYPTETRFGAKVTVRAEGLPGKLTYYGDPPLLQLSPGQCLTDEVYLQSASHIRDDDVTVFNSKGVFLLAYSRGTVAFHAGTVDAPRWWPARLGRVMQARIRDLFSGDDAGFLLALLTGRKGELSTQADVDLSEAGVYHILAVSGMHCAYLLAMVGFLAGKHRRRLTAAAAIPTLIFYAVLTGGSPSVVRACVMLSFLTAAPLFRRESDPPTAMLAALFLILAVLLGYDAMRESLPDTMYVDENSESPFQPLTKHPLLTISEDTKEAEKNEFGETGETVVECSAAGIPLKKIRVIQEERPKVAVCGAPVGIYMETDGVMVIRTAEIRSSDGTVSRPSENILREGDYITKVNGQSIRSKQELIDAVKVSNGSPVCLSLLRDGETIEVQVTPQKSQDGTCRLGAWVRDNMQGIGTLTFVEPDGTFAALGHGISDVDTGKMLQLNGGELYLTQILSVIPGKAGVPGELQGVIHYEEKNRIGSVAENTIYGIHGVLDREKSSALPLTVTEIAYRQEIETGPATVRMCVDNTVEEYEAEITEIDLGSENTNKNFVLEITDQRLLQKTGGIVQGNSGSPVLQNGRLIGAITHVFVNHPEKGYGVFAENMLARN